jgi:hypothetical protein
MDGVDPLIPTTADGPNITVGQQEMSRCCASQPGRRVATPSCQNGCFIDYVLGSQGQKVMASFAFMTV